ncbi:ribosome small subunit-dependent GTPase A [Latilactobacillus curvatus]|uniref:Small ribosomal subunit biogenesis GTPase RsgA n=1 Tax=Latilactobacillus curvatus TaxID=28038 RepID=A0ABM7QSW1_LATCU|nr:ribosome small subunit-dependent GTPase A [Latilactobacillus curvatus]ANJ69103.1 ribosome small subunit-dependent GTPase A [Latilactobacillus curvatus]AOO75765.1 ribosome small subunit-dependent GTPase A [Latilactobacillus curvatus]QEA49453.1 ribosome small subunit-dependent GTPase A [Latilactobacillus curvatus]WBY48344.1 ribosome small subunit-dependent GTPase A [Latilactobacillus curvatus]WIE00328.1 ribosome small subunit-dependent GTPase A [Latilactobacillus curvatus]
MQTGQIIRALSGFYDVQSEGKIYRTRARGNFRKRKITPLVGDFVEFESESETESGYILEILDRKNEMIRPPVANIDNAVVIVSAVEPAFSLNLLDRFLIYIESLHMQGLVYLTKTDMISDQQYQEISDYLAYYAKIGYQIFAPRTAFTPAIITAIEDTFPHKTTVFTGQTGAGKSTLLNHIDPSLNIATAEISQSLNRGKHTTRHIELIPLNDGLVGDTPGFSSLGLLNVTIETLVDRFPEFREIGQGCKFRTCQHVMEPKCAVKEAVDSGEIMQSRYTNYLQFRAELKDIRPVYKKSK